jgi:cytoskeletal protein CcmA (bactofilin family)
MNNRSGGTMREERRVAAWIGPSVVIEGNLRSSEDTTIAGTVNGDIAVPEHTVVIVAGGRVNGDVVARSVSVFGEVRGAITADQRVELGETGVVHGDLRAPRMGVAEGAVVHGQADVGKAPKG